MQERTLLDYWITLYSKKKELFIIIAVSVLTAVLLGEFIKPVYETSTVFYVPSSSSEQSYLSSTSLDKLSKNASMPAAQEQAQAPYIGILKSKQLAQLVHEEFPEKKYHRLLTFDIDIELTDEFMLKVYSRDNDPVLAANIANSYAKNFNKILQDTSLKSLHQDKILLDNKMSEINMKLNKLKEILRELEEDNNIASIGEESKLLMSQRSLYEEKLYSLNVLIEENEDKINSVTEQLRNEEMLYSNNKLSLSNPLIEHFNKQLADLSMKMAAAGAELKEKHPDYLMLKNQYELLEQKLNREIERFVSSQLKSAGTFYEQLREELVNLLIEKNRLVTSRLSHADVMEDINSRLNKFSSVKDEWNRVNDEVKRYEQAFEQLSLNYREADMQIDRQMQIVVLVDSAEPPEKPSFPILWINVIVSIICGVILWVFYVFFIEYVNVSRIISRKKLIQEILSEE